VRKVSDILRARFLASEEAAELYVDEVLDGSGRLQYLGGTVSVRGLAEAEARMVADAVMYKRFSGGDPHGS